MRYLPSTLQSRSGALLACVLFVSTAWAAPFSNGSFEQPGGAPIRVIMDKPGNIPGWVHDGDGTEVYESSGQDAIDAQDGQYYISFGHNGTTGGKLFQTFDTVPGVTYSVTYQVTLQQGTGGDQKMSLIATNGQESVSTPLSQANTTISSNQIAWTSGALLQFVAVSSSTRITFVDTSEGSGGVNWGLHNVKVTPAASSITANFMAVVSGSLADLSIEARVVAASADENKALKIYVVVLLPNGLVLAKSGDEWELVGGLPLPVAREVVGSAEPEYVPLVSRIDLRGAEGTKVYVGYGTDDIEMLTNGRFSLIYTAQ